MNEKLKDIINTFENSHIKNMKYEDSEIKIELNKDMDDNIIKNSTVDRDILENIERENIKEEDLIQNLIEVKSPMVGIFYSKTDKNSAPLVKVGDRVKKGDILCIIEAVKMFNEITSPVDGVIEAKLAQDEALIEYDQVLYMIRKNA